jgi:WD40 repeat protein
MKNESHYCRVLAGFLLLLCASATAVSQRTRPQVGVENQADVAFAIKFSPDGKTLAIARGATEPIEQFGRIELWDTETGSLRRVIQGFDGPVRSLTFTPDSKTIISASLEYHSQKLQKKPTSRDGEISSEVKWWDASTGDLKQKIEVSSEDSISISIAVESSPDGKQVAVVHSLRRSSPSNRMPRLSPSLPLPVYGPGYFNTFITSELRLLDSASGQQKIKVNIKSPGILAYSGDGKFVATIGDNQVKIFDANTGKGVGELKDFRGSPNALAFSPDSQSLAVVSTKFDRETSGNLIRIMGRSEVKIFDVKDWSLSTKLNDLGAVRCVTYEPSGRYLLLGGMLNDREKVAVPALKIWDLKSRAIARYPTGGESYDEAVKLVTISQDGRMLALASGDDLIKFIDTHGWKIIQTMDASSVGDKVKRPVGRFVVNVKTILEVAFNTQGTLVTAESDQGDIKQWDPRTGELKFQLERDEGPTLVSASLNSRSFAELADGELTLWSFDTRLRRSLELPQHSPPLSTAFSSDGLTLVVVIPGQVLLYDATTDQLSKSFSLPGFQIDSVAISNSKQTIAVADSTGGVRLLTISDGSVRQMLPGNEKVLDLRFSPDDRILASAAGRDINLFDTQTGSLIKKLAKHDAAVNEVAFSANGRLLASGSDDRTAIIWQIDSGKSKHVLKGHDQTVRAVAFSPDGNLLASGSGNGSVALWEVASGNLNRVLR